MAVHTQTQPPRPVKEAVDPAARSRPVRAPQDSRGLEKKGSKGKLDADPMGLRSSRRSVKLARGTSRLADFASRVMRPPDAASYRLVDVEDSDLKLAIPDSFALKKPEAQRRELRRMLAEVQEIASKPVPVKKAATGVAAKAKPLPGWTKLLEKSLAGQTRTLQSDEFVSVAQAAPLLGVEDAAVRRRIREGKLLALKHPRGGEHRIPIWATGISGVDTKALVDLAGDSMWDLYQFMGAPHGAMKAMRPCDLLVAAEHLPMATRGAREALAASLKANGTTLLAHVLRALKEHVSREA